MKSMPWSRDDIRKARGAHLAPLLIAQGYRLRPLMKDNYAIVPLDNTTDAFAGLIVKKNFWVWPDRNIAGNAIDFLRLGEAHLAKTASSWHSA
jgi:hypothetical protein